MFIRARNLSYSIILTLLLTTFSPMPSFGAEATPTVQERLSRLEGLWNSLLIGGGFSLSSDYYQGGQFKSESFEYNSDSYLFLDTRLDQNFSLYFLLEQQHRFGDQGFPGIILLNEAALRYRSPCHLFDVGRFKFTLDPLGLIADHYLLPLEGLAIQLVNADWYLGGYYSRPFHLITKDQAAPPTQVSLGDDEFALRVALPGPKYLIGATLVHQRNSATREAIKDYSLEAPLPPTVETALGLDLTTSLLGGNLQFELAWLTNSNYPQSRTRGFYGVWEKAFSRRALAVDLWSFPQNFHPNYSSINRLQDRLIIPGSRGVIGEACYELPDNWSLTARSGLLFLEDEQTGLWSAPQTVLSGKLKKHFSPAVTLEMGVDWGVEFTGSRYHQLVIKTTALF